MKEMPQGRKRRKKNLFQIVTGKSLSVKVAFQLRPEDELEGVYEVTPPYLFKLYKHLNSEKKMKNLQESTELSR